MNELILKAARVMRVSLVIGYTWPIGNSGILVIRTLHLEALRSVS